MHYLFTHQLLYHISEAKLNKLPKRKQENMQENEPPPSFLKVV